VSGFDALTWLTCSSQSTHWDQAVARSRWCVSRGIQAGREWERHITVHCSAMDSNSAWHIEGLYQASVTTFASCNCTRLCDMVLATEVVAQNRPTVIANRHSFSRTPIMNICSTFDNTIQPNMNALFKLLFSPNRKKYSYSPRLKKYISGCHHSVNRQCLPHTHTYIQPKWQPRTYFFNHWYFLSMIVH